MVKVWQGDTKAIQIHIPKTGGTTVTKLLYTLFDYEVVNKINGRGAAHLPIKYINRDCPTFTFVRDPVSWHESVWKMMKDMHPHFAKHRAMGFDPVSNLAFLYEPVFEKFIDNVLERCPKFYTEVMELYLGEGLDEVDCVGRTENLNEDLYNILKKFNFNFSRSKIFSARSYGVRDYQCSWGFGQKGRVLAGNEYTYQMSLTKQI